jgi:hypothetical protein
MIDGIFGLLLFNAGFVCNVQPSMGPEVSPALINCFIHGLQFRSKSKNKKMCKLNDHSDERLQVSKKILTALSKWRVDQKLFLQCVGFHPEAVRAH